MKRKEKSSLKIILQMDNEIELIYKIYEKKNIIWKIQNAKRDSKKFLSRLTKKKKAFKIWNLKSRWRPTAIYPEFISPYHVIALLRSYLFF